MLQSPHRLPGKKGRIMGATTSRGEWSTRDLPAGQRAAAARAMLSRVHLPWELRLGDRDPYGMRLAWHDLGGCSLIECHSAPLAGSRGGSEIRRTEGDHVGLLHVLSGRERVRQGESRVELADGDLLLWDGARPLDFAVLTPLHKITLLIPRDRLERALPQGGFGGARRLDGLSGLGGILAGHLASLGRLAAGIAPGDAPLAADLVVDLLDRLLAPSPAPALDRAAGRDLLRRILAFVEAHLDDPDLTPSRIATALGISPRYLHMVFAETGGTLGAHIRDRRLQRIRRDLADPRLTGQSITEIVFRWGFNDTAHASRAFSKAFGVSPSRFRAEH
jgi:AraC-like DNA-binding protein